MYNVYADNRLIGDPSAVSASAITGTITKAVNGIDAFVFRIFSNNVGWDKIACLKTHIDVEDVITGDKNTFHGRILKISPTQESNGLIYKDVQCEGELSYLQDSTQIHHSAFRAPYDYIFTRLLYDHNNQVDDGKKIYLGQCPNTGSVTYEWGYVKTWEALQEFLALDGVGGEIRLRYADGKRYLDYTPDTFSGGSDTVIEAGVNLVALTQTIDPTALVTDLYAYGAKIGNTEERIALPNSIFDGTRRTLAGGIVAGTVIFDDISDTTALATAAQAYYDAMQPIKKQYKITAADLSVIDQSFEEFKLGYQYRSRNDMIGVDEVVRLIGIQIKIEDRTKNTLTFGDKFDTLTTMTSKKSKEIKLQFDKQPELIEGIVEHQSEIIRGVEGGYRYDRLDSNGKPLETIYMNSADVNTATQALRINQNGLGFWKKGTTTKTPLNGNYDYAWTIDGLLNTAYITAQTITGLKFNNGNGTFEVDSNGNVTAKAITIKGGKINIETSNDQYDFVKLHCDDGQGGVWNMEILPNQLQITNSSQNGYIKLRPDGVWGYWGNQAKFHLSSTFGSLNLYGTNGVHAMAFDANNNFLAVKDGSGNQTILLNGNTGEIHAAGFIQT